MRRRDVTHELALRRENVETVFETRPTQLHRRLDRFRQHVPPTARLERRRASGDVSPVSERARSLAEAVGGQVIQVGATPVVTVDSAVGLPFDRAGIGRLPYRVEAGRPLVCLDTETTGLGLGTGTLVFLVGLGWWDGAVFRVRQFLLADQPHETALLAAVAGALAGSPWLVTYNGRSFDWPLLVGRYRLHGSGPPAIGGQLDLLPVARQLWKHRLTDARLATVEAGVVGVRRVGDLPGGLIPERYFAYLADGDGRRLRRVLEHNRQDVVSLARLLVELTDRLGARQPPADVHPGDLHGLARAYARLGDHEDALRCLETAFAHAGPGGVSIRSGPAALAPRWQRERIAADRARLLARTGSRAAAAAAWLELASSGGPLAALAWIHVAKHREHELRDPAAALAATRRASALLDGRRWLGRAQPHLEQDVRRRTLRLRRRLASGAG